MATSMKMSETDSSDSEDDSTDDSSGSEGTELYLSSWAYIHRSLKEVVGSGNSLPIDPRPVYHSAIQALVHGDPFSALKLFSLGLSEQLRAVLIIQEHTLSEGNDDHPRLSQLISVKIVCHAMNLCIDFRDKLTVSTKTLRRSLRGVVDNTVHCCDMLALTDVSLLSSAAGLYFRYKVDSLNRMLARLHLPQRFPAEGKLMDILLCPKNDGSKWNKPDCVQGKCKECPSTKAVLLKLCEDILPLTINWTHWERRERKLDAHVKNGTVRELVEEFVRDIEAPLKGCTFVKHLFTAYWQQDQYSQIRRSLEAGELLMVMDFAENRKAMYNEEVKSAHFGKSQMTLHPVVCYHRSGDHVARHVLMFISDDITHDYHMVHHFTVEAIHIMRKVAAVPITKIYIFSDGCAAQYKGRGTFADLSLLSGCQVQRLFFGSEHGKGEADGETGVLSQAMDRAVKGGSTFIRGAEDLYRWAEEHLAKDEPLKRRTFVLVKGKDIDRNRPETEVVTIPGTRQLHQIERVNDYIIKSKLLGCLCAACRGLSPQKCPNAEYTGDFVLHKLKRSTNGNKNLDLGFLEEAGQTNERETRGETSVPGPSSPRTQPTFEQKDLRLPRVGEFVKVAYKYDRKIKSYFGVVVPTSIELEEEEVLVHFYKSMGSYQVEPQVPDECAVSATNPDVDHMVVVPPPRIDGRGRLDETQKALHVAGRAVEMNPDSISTHETLENLCCNLVERWHFVMLNDKVRNCAYQQAIQAVLRETPKQATVCDVGCGTGLLSLIAAEQPNCSQVFAVEKSSVMCTITRDVLTANQESVQAEKIRVINKMSSRMSVPADMSDKVDILVTETFDGGLFGEGILPTLCHAWSNLLKNSDKEKGQVIPGKAELYMQGIESDFILRENRWIGRFRDLDTSDLHMYSTVGMCDRDPYTCHDLKYLPGGYKTLTKPVKFMDVDFNDPEGLLLLKKGYVQKATLDSVTRGRLDALVMWFTLHLDSSTHISTHTDTNCCWEQAVFPVCPLKLVEQQHPNGSDATLHVKEGDTVHVAQRVKGGRLVMAVTDISRQGRSKGKCSSDVAESSVPLFLSDYKEWCRHKVYCLAGWEVITLNNTALQDALHEELRELFKLSRKRNENAKTHFIHLNDAFSPLCLQALNLGYHHVATVTLHPVHKTLLWKMATDNNIDIGRITAIEDAMEFRRWTLQNMGGSRSAETVDQPGNVTSETSAGFHGPCSSSEGLEATESEQMPASHTAESSTSSRTRPWSVTGLPRQINAVVLCDFVDYQGRIVEGLSNHLKAMRRCLSQYSSKAIYPSSVDVYGVLIDSDQLQRLSRLESDDNTLGFKIAAFINKFATRNHQGIAFISLPHKKLSKPFKMFSIDLRELVEAPGFLCNSHEAAKPPEKTLIESNDSKLGTTKTHSSSYTEEFKDELPSDHIHTAVKETVDSGQKEHKDELSNTIAEQNQVSDKCGELKSSSEIHDKTKVFVSELRESDTSDPSTQTSHLLEKPLDPIHDRHDSTTKRTLLDRGECAPSTSSKTENNTASQKGPFFSSTPTQEETLVYARTPNFNTNSPTIMSSSQPSLPHEHSAHHHDQQPTRLPTVDLFSSVPYQNEKGTVVSGNSSTRLTSGDNTLCKSSQTTRTSHMSALSSSGDHSSATSSGDHSSSTSSGDHIFSTSSGDHISSTSSGDHSSSTSSGDHSSLPHPAAQNQDMKPLVTTTTDSSCTKSYLTVAESSTNSLLDSDSSRGEIDKSSMKRNLRADNLSESEASCSGIKRKRLSKEKEERGGGSADADMPESALEDDELEDSDPQEMKQTVHVKVPIVHSGNLTALVYWFDLHLSPSHSINTLDPNHHWQQAAVMTHVSQRRHVTQGDVLNLCLQLCNSAISFMVKDEN